MLLDLSCLDNVIIIIAILWIMFILSFLDNVYLFWIMLSYLYNSHLYSYFSLVDSRNVPFLSERSSCDREPKGCEWETTIKANQDSDPPTPDLTCLPLSSWGKRSPLPQKVVKGTMVVRFHRFFNGRNTVYLKHCHVLHLIQDQEGHRVQVQGIEAQ